MNDIELTKLLQSEGYYRISNKAHRGVCGWFRFIFTIDLCYGLDEYGYKGRWSFPLDFDISLLDDWDGTGDPTANWIKHKGFVEYERNVL